MTRLTARAAALAFVCATAAQVSTQTPVELPKNKFTPDEDVKLGREAAAEVRQQFPIITDERITSYLTTLGDRLVAAAPPSLNQPVYEYSFTPVNVKEINAFALPGGPMFVNRGMFDAAADEAEVVGVMAHELSHVLLRHGTANASKAQNPWLQLGQLAGAVGGSMLGGQAGSAVTQGTQLGLGTLLLRYSRDYEKQADLLGSQIMARAGYDPRALAHMFETIERESKGSGGSGPQWLSSHPNPGNRTQYITKEAEALTVAAVPDMSRFAVIKTTFASLPPAKSMADLTRGGGGSEPPPSVGTPGEPIPRPSAQYRAITSGKLLQASIPSDWTVLSASTSIKAVPQNGYGQLKGQTVFGCGVEFGLAKAASRDLHEATNTWLKTVAQANPDLRAAGTQQPTRLSDRPALFTPLANPSPLGGQEAIGVYTTLLADGTLFYYLTVVPEPDAAAFQEAFRHVADSIRLNDGR